MTHDAARAEALALARRQDSTRRQRVLAALDQLSGAGEEISVARAARVDRSFPYRHHDLRAQVLQRAAQAQPDASLARTTQVGRQSLLADLANLRADNERPRRQVNKLARRLSEVLGEKSSAPAVWGPGRLRAVAASRR